MRKTLCCCGAILLTACNSPAMRDNDLKAAARTAAETRFTSQCGTVIVPDRAYLPLDITGDGRNDYVLSFARADCEKNPNLWAGTGGSLYQVWTDDSGRPRMILERSMFAFRHDFKSAMLITDQLDRSCPAGADVTCRVAYRWDPSTRVLRIAQRQSMPDEPLLGVGGTGELPRRAALSSQSAARSDLPEPPR